MLTFVALCVGAFLCGMVSAVSPPTKSRRQRLALIAAGFACGVAMVLAVPVLLNPVVVLGTKVPLSLFTTLFLLGTYIVKPRRLLAILTASNAGITFGIFFGPVATLLLPFGAGLAAWWWTRPRPALP